MIGSRIEGRYRVEQRLTRLGPLELFEGLDDQEGEGVWIKRLGPPLAGDVGFRDGWRSQLLSVRGAASLSLPVILSFGDSSDGTLYQVEERPRGISLARFVATRSAVPPTECVRLVAVLADAVGTAHQAGVAHGSLSPDDLYLEEESDGQLRGFVSGWEGEEVAVALRSMGTPPPDGLTRYQAPEQKAQPARPTTPASDVYSLGLILYELLTQPLPYDQGKVDAADLLPARRLNPEVPQAVEQVLTRALNRDPAQRPPQGSALASALRQSLAQPDPPPTVAPTPPPTQIIREQVRVSRPGWLPLALAVALATICLLLAVLVQQRQRLIAPATATPAPRVVPNLVGPPYLRYNEAVQLAWNEGFVVSIVNFESSSTFPPGTVIRQCPAPGALPGAVLTDCTATNLPPPSEETIFVDVVGLPSPIVLRLVPDLYGQSEDEARAALMAGGLNLGTRRTAFDQLMPAGRIIEQNPRRGLAVLPGTQIDYIVSAGPPSGDVSGAATGQPIAPPESFPTAEPTITLLPTAAPTTTPPPTVQATTTTSGQTLLFQDDFEQGNVNGWREQEAEGVVARIAGGNFQIAAAAPTPFFKSEPSGLFSDFTYRATVALSPLLEGQNNGAGIIFRSQGDDSFYFFEINNQSEYRLRARAGESWLDIVPWTKSDSVQAEGRPNVLQVEARADQLVLSANGATLQEVATPPDAAFSSGAIGVAVEGADAATSATFDNIEVER